jgi:hypothetical protein
MREDKFGTWGEEKAYLKERYRFECLDLDWLYLTQDRDK